MRTMWLVIGSGSKETSQTLRYLYKNVSIPTEVFLDADLGVKIFGGIS